jgi:hypothetical protein
MLVAEKNEAEFRAAVLSLAAGLATAGQAINASNHKAYKVLRVAKRWPG